MVTVLGAIKEFLHGNISGITRSTASIFFLVLIALMTAVHLYDSWKDNDSERARTKPFLLIFVTLYYMFAVPEPSWLLVFALSFSWMGDVLLIPKGHGWFTAGGISFMLSHFLFIAVYVTRIDFQKVSWGLVIPVALIYYAVAAVVIFNVQPTTPKPMVVPMYIYLLANSTMNTFALMQLCSNRSLGAWVAFIGAILFFISDCTLFLVRYYKNKNLIFKRHFTVMATYVIGEFLITQGIIMLTL